jgi:glycine betaine/proline transport system permease protein
VAFSGKTGGQARVAARLRIDPALAVWIGVAVFAASCFFYRSKMTWLVSYPEAYIIPLSEWLNTLMQWIVDNFRWFFRGLSWLLTWPITWCKGLLLWMPWPATMALFTMLALAASGWRLAVFTCLALFYMVVIGYWDESMNTLALVFMAVLLALGVGFSLGVLAFRSRRADRIIQPALDLMQVVPTFAYLIPILLLFGFGLVVGLIATAIYSCPPMVRNVVLALRRIPRDIVESGQMSGATNRQLLWWVQIPTAMPTIMIGVNQTIMAALSMVIIAAIIGSSADIGWEVLSSMRKAQFGQSLLSGLVIALMAMIMDRISRGFAHKQLLMNKPNSLLWQRHRVLIIALMTAVLFILLAEFQPALREYPSQWVLYPAAPLNDAVMYITVNYTHVTDTIKETFLFYFLLPLRIGLESVVRPFSWGFELTRPLIMGYAAIIGALSILAWFLGNWRAGVAIALAGTFMYFGFSKTPWPAFIVIITVLAWQIGGFKVGLFSLGGLVFLLTTGVWPQTMLSVYLCGAAAVTSFIIGGSLGIWASQNDRVSAFLRPIYDTLQTMPLFVFLIPVLMFFQIGEFSAFLAIIAYAVVPSIRYTEHGLRNVPHDVVEAARAMGCSKWHILVHVRLPLALPEIMLGLNQTIMFALAMLVITALVGSKGLGQSVYIALTKADFGLGMISGLGMALIAIIADRIIQGWSRRKKMVLGYM